MLGWCLTHNDRRPRMAQLGKIIGGSHMVSVQILHENTHTSYQRYGPRRLRCTEWLGERTTHSSVEALIFAMVAGVPIKTGLLIYIILSKLNRICHLFPKFILRNIVWSPEYCWVYIAVPNKQYRTQHTKFEGKTSVKLRSHERQP